MEKIEYKKCTILVDSTDDVESPREWNNLGTIITWHRNYKIGEIDGLIEEPYKTDSCFECIDAEVQS